jgi:hypothetical protein
VAITGAVFTTRPPARGPSPLWAVRGAYRPAVEPLPDVAGRLVVCAVARSGSPRSRPRSVARDGGDRASELVADGCVARHPSGRSGAAAASRPLRRGLASLPGDAFASAASAMLVTNSKNCVAWAID